MTEAQQSALDMARYTINREHGSGALFYGKDLAPITYTRTGLKSLDAATGGGIPRGHIVEIHGAEGTGKTSLALALAFRMGGPVLYIDADHAASRGTLSNIGRGGVGVSTFTGRKRWRPRLKWQG